ncbi:MAG TPA: hypothetical protein VMU42_12700, partial [Candidatus Sulfotelmatobacter sp.]|nr:hypothetical protein [Candidatus Sulfotelmatobacter sp.]
FGVPVERIRRNLDRSDRFRALVKNQRRYLMNEAADRYDALLLTVAEGLARTAAAGDAKVLLWLAERLGLGQRQESDEFLIRQFEEKYPPAERQAITRRMAADGIEPWKSFYAEMDQKVVDES